MNSEIAELRKLLDMFEGAGFTMTDLHARYFSHLFEITIKSSSITKLKTATAGEIVSLVEKNGYRVLNYSTDGIISKYEGTIYLKIAAREKETTP
jgi:hypothetical protein